jgi:hypothetical protein
MAGKANPLLFPTVNLNTVDTTSQIMTHIDELLKDNPKKQRSEDQIKPFLYSFLGVGSGKIPSVFYL